MDDFRKMSQAELSTKLKELKELYDEVEEERHIVLGQENLHLHAAIAKNYEEEIKDIQDKIGQIEALLK
ncbi:MAG: hypothetical protein GX111_06140 [Clostridiales bacterium]|nr:hypothetical protein [Clostridiales bacterium]